VKAIRHRVLSVSDASKEPSLSVPASPARLGVPRDLAPLYAALSELITRAEGLAPEDSTVLTKLWPAGFSKPLGTLRSDIERLVHLGLVRRVFIGTEPHLVLPAFATQEPVAAERALGVSTDTAKANDPERDVFELQVRVDTETEGVLLYRVLLVVLVIAGFVAAREWLLWAQNL